MKNDPMLTTIRLPELLDMKAETRALRAALQATYEWITQPNHMTPEEITYPVARFNELTRDMRLALKIGSEQ
jgi:hypothetical protein